MAEENVFVGTNCQSFDPSKVQCDKEGNMPIHILDKYCEENDTRYEIYPLTIIQAIFDGITGTRLDRILASCNSVYLTWEGTFSDTVSKLDKIYRRKGYIITYRDDTNVNWTQRYNSDDISDEAWNDPNNWEGWSFDTVIKDLAEALEEIFSNIGEYKEFLDILTRFVNEFVINVFNNINNYPELVKLIKNSTVESLPIIIKDIFNNINDYPEIKNIFNEYVKQWTEIIFNNIASYPALSQFITNAINAHVENTINNIFNNLDNYPAVKNLIVNNTINKVIDIFKNIGQYPELQEAIQNNVNERVDYIFNNINQYPELIGILSDLVCNCVKNIFANINNYPALVTCINNAVNNRVDYIFNNIDRFPILKNLIETKVEARVTYIFENINSFTELLNVIKGDIENIFDNVDNHPNLKTVIENKVQSTVETILSNIDNYPVIKEKITLFVNEAVDAKKGIANGIASLDEDGKVPASQLPAYVDDVLEGYFVDETHFAEKYIDDAPVYYTPEKGKIYVDISEDTEYSGKTYRWSGTKYAVISETLALGEVTGTAYDGGKGRKTTAITNSLPNTIVDTLEFGQAYANYIQLKYHYYSKQFAHNQEEDDHYTAQPHGYVDIPIATTELAGAMSAADKTKLEQLSTDVANIKNNVINLGNAGSTIADSELDKIDLINTTSVFINFNYLDTEIYSRLIGIRYKEANSGMYLYGIKSEVSENDEFTIIKYNISGDHGVYNCSGYNEINLSLNTYSKEETNQAITEAVNQAIAALIPDGYELVLKEKE